MKPTGSQPPNPYLKTKILTASPEELRLMLYEGVLRFCRQAKTALTQTKPDFEGGYNNIVRAQKIVLELSTSLRPEVAPDLCQKLDSLYTYIYRRLVDANTQRDVAAIDEAMELLGYEKETWQLLMQRLEQEGGRGTGVSKLSQLSAGQAPPTDLSGPQQTAISSFSADG